MLVLGIGDHVICGSALVQDGKIIAAINDERLVREKMVFGIPRESIKQILTMHSLKPSDIDAIAISTINQHLINEYLDYKNGWFGLERSKFKQFLFETGSNVSKFRSKFPVIEGIYYYLRKPAFRKRRLRLKEILKEEFGFHCPVHFIDHHLCHITSAYYTSNYRDATVFSIDGGGDAKSARIYNATNGRLEELESITSFDSLGCFYSYITQMCGFKAGKHEGKITGLAAYGEPQYVPHLKKIMIYEEGKIKNIANVFYYSALKELEKLLPKDYSHKDLAASIQVYIEEMVVDLVRYWLKKTNHYNVALAGGLFANVKINQKIHEIPEVQSVFVHPGMSDEGMPVGAALELFHRENDNKYDHQIETMSHVYLGPGYNQEEIKSEIEKNNLTYNYYVNVEKEIAKLLSSNAVVARYNEKMEYGPRALGNRTILYHANDPTISHWMNDALKRTEFMPFAPIVMSEYAEKCFKNISGAENTARFMTITFECTDWMIKNCPGVVHIDKTARPQLVSENDNPSMYKILLEYYKFTGIPCLINTSFNMHEEPIVCTPYDAVRAFLKGKIDYLAIGNFILQHDNPVERKVDYEKFNSYLNRTGKINIL